jgi:hypothetical protein
MDLYVEKQSTKHHGVSGRINIVTQGSNLSLESKALALMTLRH